MRSVSYGAYAAVRESLPWETRPSGGPAVFSSLGGRVSAVPGSGREPADSWVEESRAPA